MTEIKWTLSSEGWRFHTSSHTVSNFSLYQIYREVKFPHINLNENANLRFQWFNSHFLCLGNSQDASGLCMVRYLMGMEAASRLFAPSTLSPLSSSLLSPTPLHSHLSQAQGSSTNLSWKQMRNQEAEFPSTFFRHLQCPSDSQEFLGSLLNRGRKRQFWGRVENCLTMNTEPHTNLTLSLLLSYFQSSFIDGRKGVRFGV